MIAHSNTLSLSDYMVELIVQEQLRGGISYYTSTSQFQISDKKKHQNIILLINLRILFVFMTNISFAGSLYCCCYELDTGSRLLSSFHAEHFILACCVIFSPLF